jgi:ribosomal protein S18 acetylase RimI-like enzyme
MRKTTADLSLRPRRPSDDGFIYRLSERIFAAYSQHPTGSMASMLAEDGALAFVAERGAVPVGFFVLGFEHLGRSYGPWQHPSVARLNAIGVQPDWHGRGIGGFLLERAEAVARDRGAVSLSLMTAETNTRARRLFTGNGYQRVLTLERSYAGGQRGLVMTKPLTG